MNPNYEGTDPKRILVVDDMDSRLLLCGLEPANPLAFANLVVPEIQPKAFGITKRPDPDDLGPDPTGIDIDPGRIIRARTRTERFRGEPASKKKAARLSRKRNRR